MGKNRRPKLDLNIFPELDCYERPDVQGPSTCPSPRTGTRRLFPGTNLTRKNFDPKERIAQAYWMSKLALFEKSGIGAFGFGAVRAAELNMEESDEEDACIDHIR